MTRKEIHKGHLSRRDALKLMGAGLGGLLAILNLPDWMHNEGQFTTNWYHEKIWGYASASVRAAIPNKVLQIQVDPNFNVAPYQVTLSHVIAPYENGNMASVTANVYDAAIPNQAIFEAAKYLREVASNEIYAPPNSTGAMGIVTAAMYPEKVIARKMSSLESSRHLENVDPAQVPSVQVLNEGKINWQINESYGGEGRIIPISDNQPIMFVHNNQNGQEGDVVGMTPRQWLLSTTGMPAVEAIHTNHHAGISLEHTCPSAWIAETDGRFVALAGNYANLGTFSYAPQVFSDATLRAVQRNTLLTPSPFTHFGENISGYEARILSEMPEEGFNSWKNDYPQLKYAVNGFGDTMVYNSQTGLFRFINKDEREETLLNLSPNEVWTTPGETFPTAGKNYYEGAEIFGNKWDLTLNGMMLVPEEDGYRPTAFITTDQNKRFSLFQAQEMVMQIGKEMAIPPNSAFVNWDRHGAGGLFLT